MSTTVTYKGSTLTTVDNQTRTLKTAGKYMEGDVILTDVTSGGSTINNQNKTVTPTESQQSITADNGYTGLGTVTVNAISSIYVGSGITQRDNDDLITSGAMVSVPAGYYAEAASKSVVSGSATGPSSLSGSSATITTDTNTITLTKTDVTTTPTVSAGYVSGPTASTATVALTASVTVNPTLTVSGATVTAPAGYYTTSTSQSVSSMTLPTSVASSATSGYTSKATIGRSTSAQYINIPPGYNSAGAYYVISATPNGSVTVPSSISGTAASVSTGTNTLTLTKTVSVTPVVSAGYISAGTAGNASISLTASVTTKAAATYTPGISNQTIAADTYLTGVQTIEGDADLIASNIKKNTSIFGVIGNFEGLLHLLGTVLIGEINTTSTTTTNTDKSVIIDDISDYDLLVVESSIDTVGNNRHIATVNLIFLTAGNTLNTKNGSAIASATWNVKIDNNGVITSRTNTTKYGLYANACNISNNTATIPIYRKYNATQTGPLNGTYTTRVYGAKLYGMVGKD